MGKKEEGKGISKEILDELIKGYKKPEDLIGENGILKQLTKALLERAMDAELTHELGYDKNDKKAIKGTNRRNGTSVKTASWSLRYRETGTENSSRC